MSGIAAHCFGFELGKLPTLCVLNWNAVSLSNSEPLVSVTLSSRHCYRQVSEFFKWRASLVPAAAVIPAPLAYTIIVAVKRLVVGLNTHSQRIMRCSVSTYNSLSHTHTQSHFPMHSRAYFCVRVFESERVYVRRCFVIIFIYAHTRHTYVSRTHYIHIPTRARDSYATRIYVF